MHEDIERSHEVKRSSDRSFGFVFAAVFAIVGLWPLIRLEEPRWWALAVSAIFLLVSFLRPSLLAPLNRAWAAFGKLLHKIVNPVVMGLIFYLTVVPTGIVLRLMGKDLLRTRWEKSAETYWISRQPPGPAPETMKNQF